MPHRMVSPLHRAWLVTGSAGPCVQSAPRLAAAAVLSIVPANLCPTSPSSAPDCAQTAPRTVRRRPKTISLLHAARPGHIAIAASGWETHLITILTRDRHFPGPNARQFQLRMDDGNRLQRQSRLCSGNRRPTGSSSQNNRRPQPAWFDKLVNQGSPLVAAATSGWPLHLANSCRP